MIVQISDIWMPPGRPHFVAKMRGENGRFIQNQASRNMCALSFESLAYDGMAGVASIFLSWLGRQFVYTLSAPCGKKLKLLLLV